MKWQHKGHEYDDVYDHMCQKKKYYLFGAGDYGHQFYQVMRDQIEIVGYIDNDEKKIGSTVNGLPCNSLAFAEIDANTGIILTMSQIARVSPIHQLQSAGLKSGRDFFYIEEFISVYFAYCYGKVYFMNISFLPATTCNLNCRYCLNFNPFSERFYVRNLKDLKADVDVFFNCIDRIMLFHISGGETFLYPDIAELVCYIDRKYGNRIDKLRMVTNGTVLPKEIVLKKLSVTKLEITVDDYREELPDYKKQFAMLLRKLDEYRIRHYVNKVDSWINLAPDKTDYADWSEEALIRHRSECSQNWQELRDGKLYSCNYAAYAVVTGKLGEQDDEETYDLREYTPEKAKELVEFCLGYTNKGYTNFCKYCRGFTMQNTEQVRPALQTEDRNMNFSYSSR